MTTKFYNIVSPNSKIILAIAEETTSDKGNTTYKIDDKVVSKATFSCWLDGFNELPEGMKIIQNYTNYPFLNLPSSNA